MNNQKELVSKLSNPFNIIGVEKADLGDIKLAIRYFTQAIDVDPINPKSYFNRATLLLKIGDIQGARSDFNTAQKLNG